MVGKTLPSTCFAGYNWTFKTNLRASRSLTKTGLFSALFFGLFFGSVFVSVFGLRLGAFWEPFWVRSEVFFHTFAHRFSKVIFYGFWEAFRLRFGSLLEPKIEQRVARGRKGRPLKTSVLVKENHTFRARRPPGAPKIHLRTASKSQCEFVWILQLKTIPKASQNGGQNGSPKASKII